MKSKLIIAFSLLLYLNIIFAKDVKVLSSNSSSLVFEYIPEYSDSFFVQRNNQKYFRVALRNGILPGNIKSGNAVLPFRIFNIGVPSSTGTTIQVLSSSFKTISGKILPEPFQKGNDDDLAGSYSESNSYNKISQTGIVTFGEFGLIQDLPVQKIKISPVQFNVVAGQIKLLTRIVVQINFSSPSGKTSRVKNTLLKNVVLNFNIARNWGKPVNKKLVGITVHSALATGTWFKFNISKEGIYKIDKNKLAEYGIDAATVDPRTIKIYNNGGYLLSPTVEKPRPSDLIENAIYVSGQKDGKFDDNDYILFYARGVNFWEYNPDSSKIARNRSYYTNKNYYWITSGGQPGKRMQIQNTLDNPQAVKQTETLAFISHEHDDANLMQSGIVLVGEKFSASNNSKAFMNTLYNRVSSEPINYVAQVVNYSPTSARQTVPFKLEESGNIILTRSLSGSDGSYRKGYLTKITAQYNGNLADNRSVLDFIFQSLQPDVFGYLDYFTIQYSALLKAVDDELIVFSNKNNNGVTEYNLSNFSNSSIRIFNVTDYSNVKEISVPSNWISGGEIKFQAAEQTGKISKYFAITTKKYLTPGSGEKIENSDIHGEKNGYQYIIITSRNFTEQAEKLAKYRAEEAPIKYTSKVFYTDEITNEFSCGALDPTSIRDFIKFAYDSWVTRPKFVLLFGDGDWDYYNLLGYGTNFVPTYQTHESYHEIYSYPYDDYFARISGNDKSVDIALGRLPVNNTDEADNIVNKIIEYENSSDRDLWRNTITLVADDGPQGQGIDDGNRHTRQSEDLSKNFIAKYFNQDKIYLAAYPTVLTGLGRRKPAVNKAIVNALNNGTLIINFIGHGNPTVWTHEGVFQQQIEIPQLTNSRYFFLSAATCDYGKFDDPEKESSPEEMMGMKDRGMIGGFLSTRPVFSSQNAALNEQFFSHLFTRDSNNVIIPIGTAYQLTKFSRTNRNDEKFNLICDPALRLDAPKLPAKIDSLNGMVPNNNLQVKALSNTEIKGNVVSIKGGINTNFNGEAIITVFDSQRRIPLPEMSYHMDVQGGVIYRGRASVENGLFSTKFTVPKDISYENNNGKIVAYFFDDKNDGVGYTTNFIVGGTDSTAVNDDKGPKIDIYYDNFNFNNTSLVNPDFKLLVKLKDQTGLNTTGNGIGHKLEGILNNDENNAIDFSNSFIGDLDAGGKSGIISYNFNNMAPGNYSIKIKAWDVFNNLSVKTGNFTVVKSNALVIKDVFNYPNPFSSNTAFTFQQNLNEPLNVNVKVYTVAGRLVRKIEENGILEKFVKINWDGRDEDGGLLANGTYLYKLIVTSSDGKFSQSILGKLAIIR